MCRRGGIGDDCHTGEAVGGRAARLGVGGVGKNRGEQAADRIPRRIGRILQHGCQRRRRCRAPRRVVDRTDGDQDRLAIGFRAAGAGIALVIDGDSQYLLVATTSFGATKSYPTALRPERP